MISILRRFQLPINRVRMESAHTQRLVTLAQQLRLYKPPPSSFDEYEEETAGKVVSQVGFQESVTPIAHRFRPKRAAVLICLFQGDSGDFRVILTKRSSRLSTHSGLFYCFLFLYSFWSVLPRDLGVCLFVLGMFVMIMYLV